MKSTESVELLKKLIATPSITRNEADTAEILLTEMLKRGYCPERVGNNVFAYNRYFSEQKNTVVLCSHHDTVPANENYTMNPFEPLERNGRLFGLGSNDAGASLVSLFATFDYFFEQEGLPFNLCLLFTAEEESSGVNGMGVMYSRIINPVLFVVGEPTSMDVAIAERGLMVLDCEVEGISGHAAHQNTVNPIIEALEDIRWFNDFRFEKTSEVLGEVRMSVTVINAGTQHNIVPGRCCFTVDIRGNGCYSNPEILRIVKQHVRCSVKPRSLRLNPSSVSVEHPFVQCCMEQGSRPFGSSTLSDQSLVECDSVKIGVGDTLRSHTSDEWVYISEIESGIERYIEIFKSYFK